MFLFRLFFGVATSPPFFICQRGEGWVSLHCKGQALLVETQVADLEEAIGKLMKQWISGDLVKAMS